MSEINYQALREVAEAIKVVATPQKLLAFRMKVTPQVVLALLDELEHYKSREERVTKLIMDNSTSWDVLYKKLEVAENNLIDSECHVAELEEALRDKQALLEASEKRIDDLDSRTVKLPEPFKLAKSSSGLTYYYADEVNAALTAAGIRIEGE